MNTKYRIISNGVLIAAALLLFLANGAYAAKYSGEFLELGVSARALGMGGAFTAVVDDAATSYYNPAALANIERKSALFMHTEAFGSLINHDYIGGVLPLRNRNAGLGFALMRLGGGDIKLTELSDNPDFAGMNPYDDNIYVVSRIGKHADYTGLVSYGVMWKENISVGVTGKLIYRKLVDESAFGMGIDLGMKYRMLDNLRFAAVLKDASATFLSYSSGATESIYPGLNLGCAYEMGKSDFDFLLASDARIKFEHRSETAQVSLGGASADFFLGGEVTFKKRVSGRIGAYRGDLTAGAGLRLGRFTLDAAYLSHDDLDNSYRINLGGYF